jgi:hypothetical protein
MPDLSQVVDSLDEVIGVVDQKIEAEQAEKARLIALRASIVNGSPAPTASTVQPASPGTPAEPHSGRQTPGASGHRFTKRGWQYVEEAEMALKRGAKSSARLREILDTTNITRYLEELEAQGKVKQEGYGYNKASGSTRKTPLWVWTGVTLEEERADAREAKEAERASKPKQRRKARRTGEGGLSVKSRMEKTIAERYGNGSPFTKQKVIIDSGVEGGGHNALSKIAAEGLIEPTGERVRSLHRGTLIPTWRVNPQGKLATLVHLDTSRAPTLDAAREHRVHAGEGVEPGRLRDGNPDAPREYDAGSMD